VIRAAVITISDSAHQGTREDQSGPAVATRLQEKGFEVAGRRVIPDEREEIARCLRQLVERGSAQVILTTGGTGITRGM